MAIQNVPVNLIDDNPYQPRSSYSTNKIEELAYSIAQIGMRQTPECRSNNGRFQLAYGHMRKRAFAKLIKNKTAQGPNAANIKEGTMPLDVKKITDKQMIEFAVEENLRRSDITPMDTARTIELYLTNFKDETVTSAGKKFNMTQGNVSNMLRVLKCPPEVLNKINEGNINFTMARELLIFQGKHGVGHEEKWSRGGGGGYKKIPKDDKWLMLEAIKGVGGSYGPPATVDGIKKSIFSVARDCFPALEKAGAGWRDDFTPLFDTREAGCLKCEHSIICHETKSQVRHYCTNPGCWQQRQKVHKQLQAKEAKRQMEQDIAGRLAEEEKSRAEAPQPESISQEIPTEPVDIVDTIPEEERADAKKRLDNFKGFKSVPCRTCLNVGHCDGTSLTAKSGTGVDTVFACEDHMAKEDVAKVRKKATKKIPSELITLTKEKAGTRAEVLDVYELRVGSYGGLKTGYVSLKGEYNSELDHMDNPDECTKQCTNGFHYAFNSDPGYRGGDRPIEVLYICSNPKCVAKKKSAFTRNQNAAGQAKKKAEMAAIKEAVEKTVILNNSRMKLIVHYLAFGDRRGYYGSRTDDLAWFCKKLGVDTKDPKYPNNNYIEEKAVKPRLHTALEKLTEAELAKLITEYCLLELMYDGDIKSYTILTTEALQWMGINIQKQKPVGPAGAVKKEA